MTQTLARPIEDDDCKALTKEIRELKKLSPFFRDRLRLIKMSQATGIPIGSMGTYTKHDTLPIWRYSLLKQYVEHLKEQYEVFIKQ